MLCDPMNCSISGFPVLPCLSEFPQTHVHCDATQPALLFVASMQCREPWFDSCIGKIRWRRDKLLTPVFWPGEFHGVTKSLTQLSNFHFSCILQYLGTEPNRKFKPVFYSQCLLELFYFMGLWEEVCKPKMARQCVFQSWRVA